YIDPKPRTYNGYSDHEYETDDDQSTLISKLDLSSPLHLHLNDSATLIVVSVKLKGTKNYQVWSCAMLLALEGKNKTGFIDGSCRRSNTDEVLGRQWDRVNAVVLGWILNSIFEELFLGHDKVDGSVTFNLHHKINSLSQNGSSIADYCHRLNALWKQFDALVQLPRCTCHAAEDFKKHNQLMKLMQFLMGLDDCYMQIRSNILSRDELPDVRSAYAIISSEESHRVVSSSGVGTSQRSQSSVFSSNVGNRSNAQRPQTSVSHSRPSNVTRPMNNVNRRPNGGSPLVCENCGFNGHTMDRCFKLIGYPPDFGKRNNSSNTNQNNQNFNRRFISNNNSIGSSSTFSDEQISKLLSLIKENSLGDKGKGVQSNMAGANQHLTYTDKNLVNSTDISYLGIKVSHPNGTEALITKVARDSNMLRLGNFSNNSKNNWHNRLGHPSDQAKQTREPFPLSEHKSTVLVELVHLDLWGPYRVVSKEDHRYFLTIVDDFTRAVWVYLLKSKEEVFDCIWGNSSESKILIAFVKLEFCKYDSYEKFNFRYLLVLMWVFLIDEDEVDIGSNGSASESERAATSDHNTTLSEDDVVDDDTTEHVHILNNQPLRRSKRASVFPNIYNDYVVDSKVKYGLEKYVGYSNLTSEFFCFTTELNKAFEPKNY
ncbi:ribonuclease H-like domain-containing protein, partial [Tanacetum coccineum]